MNKLLASMLLWGALSAGARPLTEPLFEPHHRLVTTDPATGPSLALTLDACSGAFDAELIALLVARRVPATIFATSKWLASNPAGAAMLLAHPELFDIEDHGHAHVPATLGAGQRVYGMAGAANEAALRSEVALGAAAIQRLTGRAPRYYRGATAMYDAPAIQTIESMGYMVAGFSVNADAGATLSRASVVARMRGVRAGDVIIAHMNKPAGHTAEAFAIAVPELLARGFRFVKLAGGRLQAL